MREGSAPPTCHMSPVTCPVSCVTCQVAHIMCHIFFFFSFLDKVVKLFGGGSSPSSLLRKTKNLIHWPVLTILWHTDRQTDMATLWPNWPRWPSRWKVTLWPNFGASSKAVMSTNIWIFKYSNKMALEYYLYSYSCHFLSTNILGYSFVDFWTTKYIQIFVCKFLKIQIYFNICSNLILVFAFLFLIKKKNIDIINA